MKSVLNDICLNHELIDIWRIRNSDSTLFTWRQKNSFLIFKGPKRRLDFWLINDFCQDEVTAVVVRIIIHLISYFCNLYCFHYIISDRRYMKDKELFRKMVVKDLTLEGTRKLVGGSGLQIGKRLVKEGCHVLAAANSSAELINMLPENMSVIGDNRDVNDIRVACYCRFRQ